MRRGLTHLLAGAAGLSLGLASAGAWGQPGLAPPPVGPGAPTSPGPAPNQPAPAAAPAATSALPEPMMGAPQAPDAPGEAWLLSGDVGVALLLGKPQRDLYGPGLTGAIAGYRTLGAHLLVGLRLRGGAFLDKDGEDVSRADPGLGGLGSLSLALRLRPLADASAATRATGLWLELAAGPGLTGDLVRATAEAGLGYGFVAGRTVLSPMVRYLHVVQTGAGLPGADAKALIAGLEVLLGDPEEPPPPPPAPALPAAAPPPAAPVDTDGDGIVDAEDKCPTEPEDKDGFEDGDGCPDNDNDRDGIADADDKCRDQAEVVNGVDDQDGCPDEGLIELIDDRMVLEEKLLFETERARVSSKGQRVLQAVVTLWKQHPEWERMEVEGHADFRGPPEYNLRLSEERARRVKVVLVKLGLDAGKISTQGFGLTRPRAEGRSPEALQLNRRVELVVIRKKPAAPATPAAPPPPAAPAPPAAPLPPAAPAAPVTPGGISP
jgi:outer membrane protein OmpA-like peptidoglycan-associated protein